MTEFPSECTAEQTKAFFESQSLLDQAKKWEAKERYQDAEILLKQALKQRMSALGPDDQSVANIIVEIGLLYKETGREEEAIDQFSQAISTLEKVTYPGHGWLAPILEHQAGCYIRLKKFAEAEPILKRAIEIYDKTLSAEHRLVLESTRKLAMLYRKLGKLADAEIVLTKALKQLDTPLGPAETFKSDLAQVYVSQGKNSEAETLFKQAIEGFSYRKNYPELARCLEAYTQFLKMQNRVSDAEKAQSMVIRVRAMMGMEKHDIFSATLLRA